MTSKLSACRSTAVLIAATLSALATASAGASLSSPVKAARASVRTVLADVDRCPTVACVRARLASARTKNAGALVNLERARTAAERSCNAVEATAVTWAVIAVDDAAIAAAANRIGAMKAAVGAAGRRLSRAKSLRTACLGGALPAAGGRFAACLRLGPGEFCRTQQAIRVTTAEATSGRPQLVTRLVCAGRPFRGHWELRVVGRAPVDSSTFLACLRKSHEDFNVPLDLRAMGFLLDTRLPARTFDASLKFVDDDLNRTEGEVVYQVRFGVPAGGQYNTGVPGAWRITSLQK